MKKRLIIVYNLRSTNFKRVRAEVLERLGELKDFVVEKYEVAKTNVDDNAKKLSKILKNGDYVLAAGGDATATIAVNGIMLSDKKVTLGVLPYGNFNDLARTLGTFCFDDIVKGLNKSSAFWPLEIIVDGEFFRYASCYVTIGMTAEAVELFDDEKIRKKMQKGHKSSWRSYLQLASWYFKNRKKKEFIPAFRLNDGEMLTGISDYAAVNGRSMARVMKGGKDFLDKKVFRSETGKLTNLWNLTVLMMKSITVRVPGAETQGDVLEFVEPATIELQAEGEYRVFKDVKKIEIRKAKKCLQVLTH